MSASTNSNGLHSAMMALLVGLGLVALVAMTGCDETGYWESLGWGTQNVPSWGGWADEGYTSSLGLPESPSSYWESWGWGTQNVPSWGGWAHPWYTSSLGLPQMP